MNSRYCITITLLIHLIGHCGIGYAEDIESEHNEPLLCPVDVILNNYVQPMLGFPARDINGTDSQFRTEALEDEANDDATFMTPVS